MNVLCRELREAEKRCPKILDSGLLSYCTLLSVFTDVTSAKSSYDKGKHLHRSHINSFIIISLLFKPLHSSSFLKGRISSQPFTHTLTTTLQKNKFFSFSTQDILQLTWPLDPITYTMLQTILQNLFTFITLKKSTISIYFKINYWPISRFSCLSISLYHDGYAQALGHNVLNRPVVVSKEKLRDKVWLCVASKDNKSKNVVWRLYELHMCEVLY